MITSIFSSKGNYICRTIVILSRLERVSPSTPAIARAKKSLALIKFDENLTISALRKAAARKVKRADLMRRVENFRYT